VPPVVGLALIASSCSTTQKLGAIEGSLGLCGGPSTSSRLVFLSGDGVNRTTKVTTRTGRFKFDDLSPGNYTVKSAATGPQFQASVQLGAGETNSLVFCQSTHRRGRAS
jgi:hypothetical protein